MVFGWQGFQLVHPDDWSPISLTGTREEGYVRIASPAKTSLQVRWKQAPASTDLQGRLSAYFQRLGLDARRQKASLKTDWKQDGDRLVYRWHGRGSGRGALFYNDACSRLFFLEAVTEGKASLTPIFHALIDSFESKPGERECWSLFGLELALPPGLKLEKQSFLSGRSQLRFSAKGAKIIAERWGFGEQLVAKHGLEPWARAALGFDRGEANGRSTELELSERGGLLKSPRNAVVRYEARKNQIVAVQGLSRSEKWRPSWDWLV